MNLNSLALKPLPSADNFADIMVGPSRFTDDVWDLTDYIEQKTRPNAGKKIRFNINNCSIKTVIKQYAYYKLGKIKPQTVIGYVNTKLPSFVQYCELRQLESLEELNFSVLSDYIDWLKNEKGLCERSCYQNIYIIAEIVRVGQVKGWKVSAGNLFLQIKTELLTPGNWHFDTAKFQPIPSDVFDKILFSALHKEKDVLTKAGIIIQSQTGLRISEVLEIKKGCLSTTAESYTFLEVQIGKTEKGEPVSHKVYANELVRAAVLELEQATEGLREKSGLQELFIINNCGIHNVKVNHWTYDRLVSFIKRWDIRDKDGNLYPLKSHQFRATFVRELIKQNVSINHIMKQFSHVSIEMTMHYLTLQEHEIREIYTEMILSPESKIAGIRAAEIKSALEPHFKGKTASEIETFISDLAETMSFNPLPNGICLYDFRRGNCTNGDGCFFYNCPNYITEIQFYPILKRELDLMELEMKRFKELGRERDWQRQYIKHQHLKELVIGLEAQLND
ncbi:MAG: tyrosine-type recombinase/integrase [Clostridiaceae bacterium]|nr:tyrosine-type recombinase/integrase [Clostridiaceae bacterium]